MEYELRRLLNKPGEFIRHAMRCKNDLRRAGEEIPTRVENSALCTCIYIYIYTSEAFVGVTRRGPFHVQRASGVKKIEVENKA